MTADIGPSNGGPPARLATVAEIVAATQTWVVLPGLSKTVGESRSVKIRKISRAEVQLCVPPRPPGSESWRTFDATSPPDEVAAISAEWAEKTAAWIQTLAPEVIELRERMQIDFNAKIVSMAVLDPALTLDEARGMGDDALTITAAVLHFSGLAPKENETEEQKEGAAVAA